MRVALVARDCAPTKALMRLRDELINLDVDVSEYLGDVLNHGFSNNFNLVGVDVLLCGMSSSEKLVQEEIYACNLAVQQKVPFGFYADTFGVIRRSWFESLREKAAFVFVINDEEAAEASRLFPNASIVVSGNPFWAGFFSPISTRKLVREYFDVADNEYFLLCPGGKELITNIQLFGAAIEAAEILVRQNFKSWRVFIVPHPGDKNKANVYEDLVKWSRIPVRIVSSAEMPASHMIPGSDVIVETASTIGIEAVCQRKPVVDFFTAIAEERLKEQTGSDQWPLCQKGCAWVVRSNPYELANSIDALVQHEGTRMLMQRRQEEVFPSAQDDTLTIMANTLMRVITSAQ